MSCWFDCWDLFSMNDACSGNDSNESPSSSETCLSRVCCWPCHCGSALTTAALQCDLVGCYQILCCCPCRVCCGWYPTQAEQQQQQQLQHQQPHHNNDPYPEPMEIPFERVFEIEKKKRELLASHHARIH